ncbi:MAG: hypothetical protein ACK4NA_00230 [Alphaproteobacteria bacterium]
MSESAITSSSAEAALAEVERHMVGRVVDAPLETAPFPYFYAESAFPPEFYGEMRRHLPPASAYKKISETGRTGGYYERRLVLPLSIDKDVAGLTASQQAFWRSLLRLFAHSKFTGALLNKFASTLERAVGKGLDQLQYGIEVMLVKDLDGYEIGPHTDIKNRAVSIMFYMPSSERYEPYGTAIYRPRMPGMRSDGSRHYPFDGFERVKTMPCRANSMFAFQRNDVSFHGVEPIAEPGCERDVLLYILRWRDPTGR